MGFLTTQFVQEMEQPTSSLHAMQAASMKSTLKKDLNKYQTILSIQTGRKI